MKLVCFALFLGQWRDRHRAPRTGSASLNWIAYYASWADKPRAAVDSTLYDDTLFWHTNSEPLGVIGRILTWNGPLMSLAMKGSAALDAGNIIVIKSAESTPFTGHRRGFG